MDLPLRVLITRPSAPSQAWFAREAVATVPDSPLLRAESTQEGLVLRGMTERDLEVAYLKLKEKFPDIRPGNPVVEYIQAEKLLEPYYSATVDTPEYFLGDVVADLISRRAAISGVTDLPGGKRITADIAVAECFGYSTALRRLTRTRGEYKLELAGYRPIGGPPPPNPDDV
jgi:predicted membrane GTPase involved in stress response